MKLIPPHQQFCPGPAPRAAQGLAWGRHRQLRASTRRLSNPRSCPRGTSCSCLSPRYSEFTAQLGAWGEQAPEENKRVKKKKPLKNTCEWVALCRAGTSRPSYPKQHHSSSPPPALQPHPWLPSPIAHAVPPGFSRSSCSPTATEGRLVTCE